MCRVIGYLGPSVSLEDLLTKPANSLVNQSFDAEYHHLLQLGGSGFAAWQKGSPYEDEPLLYKSSQPAFFDKNLQAICRKTRANNVLAHIRATSYSDKAIISDENCHPFLYPGFRLALAHNGGLPGWRSMLQDIIAECKGEIVARLSGSTDTEPLYALLMSQYEDPTRDMDVQEIVGGLQRFMDVLLHIKKKHDNKKVAKLKFFLADGNDLVVANLGFGPDYATAIDQPWEELRHAKPGSTDFTLAGVVEPVWYLKGDDYQQYEGTYDMRVEDGDEASTIIVSSEPLTADQSHWTQVPFQHAVHFSRKEGRCKAQVEKLL
ncbi:MAG: class II glutamine amidotransferase [Myxococcota bacterium]|jgi:glutamine amidotransferase|nr:class II glutamine amidotransferase [Myxococcota bacterium]